MSAVAIVVLVAFAPLLWSLGERMWATEHYSFFPLVLLGSGFLAWQRYREFVREQPSVVWDAAFRSPLLWMISLGLLSVGILAHSPWPAGVGFLLSLRASINSLLTEELSRRVMPAWWFLWLAIPLPFNIDRHLILAMQLLATKLASGVLDLAGMRHAVNGVVIQLPGKSFFVEEACSGIQSLFAAVSVTIFYSILGRRGLVRTLLLTVCGIGWVLLANALRIITVTVLSTRYEIPIDEGWAHEATGAAVFVLALLMIVSTDRFLLFIAPLKPRGMNEEKSTDRSRRKRPRTSTAKWTIPAGIVATCLFGLLCLLQFSRATPASRPELSDRRGEELIAESSLPEEWNNWKRTGYTIVERWSEDPNGRRSRVWSYERSGQTVLFSLDGPFRDWHDLGLCYRGQGWTVEDERDHTTPTNEGSRYDYSELTQENGEGRHAYVTFSAFDAEGQRVSPPPFFRVGVGMRFPRAGILFMHLKEAALPSGAVNEPSVTAVYQTQAFVESQSMLTDAERGTITELFRQFTDTLRTRFSASPAADPRESAEG